MTDFHAARLAMVDCQVRPSDVTRYAIIDAMLWAPREQLVPRAQRDVAYADLDIPLGEGRALPSPRVFAKMLEAAKIREDALVLDLAPGSGYSTAVLSRLCAAVIAIEEDAALCAQATQTLGALEVDNAIVTEGSVAAGDPAHGPYDVVFINGGVERIPQAIVDQLKDGGRLVAIFMRGAVGQCRILLRNADTVSESYAFDATAPVISGFEAVKEFEF